MNGDVNGDGVSSPGNAATVFPSAVKLLAAENGDQLDKALLLPSAEGEARIRSLFSDLRAQLGLG